MSPKPLDLFCDEHLDLISEIIDGKATNFDIGEFERKYDRWLLRLAFKSVFE